MIIGLIRSNQTSADICSSLIKMV